LALRLKSYAKLAYRYCVGAKLYEKLEFCRHLGYWPNLENPRTFNERLCARKFQSFPMAQQLSDKFAVRDFVACRVGNEVLTQIYYSGDSPESIDFAALPAKFVMKGSHGSGPELRTFVWDKKAFPRSLFISTARRILRRRCGPEVNEWWYSHIPPRLIVEEMLLEETSAIPPDYKFYVFGGRVHYIQVIAGRHDKPSSRFYDRNWIPQPFIRHVFPKIGNFARPVTLDRMIEIAEKLGSSFDFLRIDLYSIERRVVFGEVTLVPGAGWIPFKPHAYDAILGHLWSECVSNNARMAYPSSHDRSRLLE
jgi:hypothetical protein